MFRCIRLFTPIPSRYERLHEIGASSFHYVVVYSDLTALVEVVTWRAVIRRDTDAFHETRVIATQTGSRYALWPVGTLCIVARVHRGKRPALCERRLISQENVFAVTILAGHPGTRVRLGAPQLQSNTSVCIPLFEYVTTLVTCAIQILASVYATHTFANVNGT